MNSIDNLSVTLTMQGLNLKTLPNLFIPISKIIFMEPNFMHSEKLSTLFKVLKPWKIWINISAIKYQSTLWYILNLWTKQPKSLQNRRVFQAIHKMKNQELYMKKFSNLQKQMVKSVSWSVLMHWHQAKSLHISFSTMVLLQENEEECFLTQHINMLALVTQLIFNIKLSL